MLVFVFLQLLLSSTVVLAKLALFKLEGEVNGQEFIYYKIIHPGNLLLVLDSVEGDADIYVSEKTTSPSYHPDSYDFHSATCGMDMVTIPKSLKRPMTVGIYGYSPHSKFTLEVYQVADLDNTSYYYNDEEEAQENSDNFDTNTNEKKEVRKSSSKVKKRLKNMSNGLWPFLELFEMIFL